MCSDWFCSLKGCSDFFSLSKQNGQFRKGGGGNSIGSGDIASSESVQSMYVR